MAPKAPKLGDRVIHHGHLHEVTELPTRPRMRDGKAVVVEGIVFENERYKVTAMLDESVTWSEADNAWYLVGRLLARNERAVCEAITGAWPPAANHEAMRGMLDSVDLSKVDIARLCSVLIYRKTDFKLAGPRVVSDGDGGLRPVTVEELSDADLALLTDYADAALAQCAELRTIRQGG